MNETPKILGIVASDRRMGNTELLVKEALHSAKADGAAIDILRLTDFQFGACKGCLQCLFAGKECPVQDDAILLFTILSGFDGIIIGAPTYIMFPPGVIKMIIDRAGIFFSKKERIRKQKGAIISVAGLRGWDHFTIPLLSMFLYSLNMNKMDIVGRMSAYAPGPGQALLDEENTRAASRLGHTVLKAVRGEDVPAIRMTNNCPICASNFFILAEGKITCPICLSEAVVSGKAVSWIEESLEHHRYTNSSAERFVNEWIRMTKTVYDKQSRTIIDMRQKYKNQHMGLTWITRDELTRRDKYNGANR